MSEKDNGQVSLPKPRAKPKGKPKVAHVRFRAEMHFKDGRLLGPQWLEAGKEYTMPADLVRRLEMSGCALQKLEVILK